jgi:uncharacterized protein YcbK (DUF882 family)
MKFTVKELLKAGSRVWAEKDVDVITLRNLEDLCRKINALGYKPPMRATSCLRSIKDQQRINPSAMGSSHLYGCAVDIADTDGKLKAWCKANINKLEKCGLWMESPEATKSWCHLQSYAPRSMSRIFNP